MIELSQQQIHALERPGATPLRLVHPKTQQRFVLIPEQEFGRLTGYDASAWTDEEKDRLRAEAVDSLGWEGMEAYQDDDA
jgi:hypothetical protein